MLYEYQRRILMLAKATLEVIQSSMSNTKICFKLQKLRKNREIVFSADFCSYKETI